MSSTPPGSPLRPPELAAQLAEGLARRGAGYRPRTRHLREGGAARYTNRLILETSPYLLQHAHNPVDWRPWGDEAFAAARERGSPVFLSVGYSTCHWCHVMEEESFEDEEIAAYLNANFIPIKVDREERPDIDAIYMSAVQALTGHGGWPMSVWLTPAREPFFGGTYFPPRDGARPGAMGFLTVLRRMRSIWDEDPERIARSTGQLLEALREMAQVKPASGLPQARTLAAARARYSSLYDPVHGGTRGAPKFPSSMPARFLLREHRRAGDATALEMATRTLERMAAGGIHDHVGGGFHRYATDERWLVPHFEKMLYDNALLAVSYLEAHQATGRADFARVVHDILAWVEREMRSPEGGFYSATDADSLGPTGEREEGWFFTWTPAEVEAALEPAAARLVGEVFGLTARGNFEGRNIFEVRRAPSDAERPALDAALARLREVRGKRPPPLRDDKVLVAWNGLLLSALARAGFVLDQPRYTTMAARAADFLLGAARDKEGRLARAVAEGKGRHRGVLEDHAFLIAGLLDLFEATGEPRWLAEARALDAVLAARFEDPQGGYWHTAADGEKLLLREKPAYDGAEPSGNSVQALNLLRLAALTGEAGFRERAGRTLGAFAKRLEEQPLALSEMLLAAQWWLGEPREIVLVAARERAELEPFLALLRGRFLPHRVLIATVEGAALEALGKVTPLVRGKLALEGKPTAYLCREGACELPATDPGTFARQLEKAARATLVDPPRDTR